MAEEREEGTGNAQEERLQALFDELKGLKDENTNLRKDILRMSYVKPPAKQEEDEGEPELDLSGLPDMSEDPEAWAKGYAQRLAKHEIEKAKRTEKRTLSQAEQRKRADDMYAKFSEQHPELAKDTDKLEVAVRKAMSKGNARGYDMDRFMYGHTDLFFEEVVEEYTKSFGPLKPEKVKEGEEEEEDDSAQNDAAWGIFGGSAGESSGKKGKGKDQEPLGSFTEDIKAWQRKAGYAH